MTTSVPQATAGPRRVLATRGAMWARALARWLAECGVRPNLVSMAGVGFAIVSGIAFVASPVFAAGARTALLLAAAGCIQLRLLCNLLDGMLAVEEGLKTSTGEIFNDLPDRISDALILVGAGYAAPQFASGAALGWFAAIAALLTAYVRVLAGSLGLTQHFIGPMAKQHRMFVLTLGTLAATVETTAGGSPGAIPIALAIIGAGSAATVIRRTARILREAEAR